MPKIIPTAEKIARLIESPQAQKMLSSLNRDAERELDAQRAAALATIKEVKARAERERPALKTRSEKCLEAYRAAEKALVAARGEQSEVVRAEMEASNVESRVVTANEAILIETAPDSVKVFERWLFDEFDRLRHSVETYPAGSSGHPALGGKKRTFIHTNSRSVKRYMEAIQAARQEVHQLVLTESSRAVIEARIVDLQRGLPNSIHMEVVEGQH